MSGVVGFPPQGPAAGHVPTVSVYPERVRADVARVFKSNVVAEDGPGAELGRLG